MTRYRYSDDDLRRLVPESESITDVMRKLGMRIAGGSHYHLSGRIRKLGLDTSHFNGRGWSKGQTFEKRRRTADEILVVLPEGSNRTHGHFLRRALTDIGVKYQCTECGINDWQGKELILDVDHIDGNWLNNLRENLRYLCPNCHSQTITFGSRNSRPSGATATQQT